MRRVAVTLLTTLLAACASSSYGDKVRVTTTAALATEYGRATVEPSTVARGAALTVTPVAAVPRMCLGVAIVWVATGGGQLAPQGMLDRKGGWQPATSPTSNAACQGPTTAESARYTLPAALGPGTYAICVTQEPDPSACGTFTVS
jgi:hypothetical protein